MFPRLFLGALACGEPPPPPEPEVPEQCRNVHVDRLATDWMKADAKFADPKTRLRVEEAGAGYRATFVPGYYTKIPMEGTKKADKGQVVFVEVLTPERDAKLKGGEALATRLVVEPRIQLCALTVSQRAVDSEGKERIVNKFDLVQMPPDTAAGLTWAPAGEPLFLGEAAHRRAAAEKQLSTLGEPQPDIAGGTVPVGAWSRVEADGDTACTFDFDLYFDDQPTPHVKVAAGAPLEGWRSWTVDVQAPYAGNHGFEIHRYRTCSGGERERIGVAALEAVLL